MNKVIIAIAIIVVVLSLSACGGGDKGDKTGTVTVSEGDAATCIALRGENVQDWTFTPLEKAANNVCWLHQQQIVNR